MTKLSRREGNRKPRNIVIIVTEGRTEELYFKGLRERRCNVLIKTPSTSATDALNLVKFCMNQISTNALDLDQGDLAICVFDTDENPEKSLIEAIGLADRNRISIAISNPSFELWLALHFTDVDHKIDRKDAHELVHGSIKGFSKTCDYSKILSPLRGPAVRRAERIWKRNKMGDKVTNIPPNPSTSVHLVINEIERLKKRNRSM